MAICQGTLKEVSDKQMTGGFSRRFARSMFGIATLPDSGLSIAMTPDSFERHASEYLQGQSISGVQRKMLVNLEDNKLVPTNQNGVYIVKPAPPALPHLPENEHAIMNLARAVGLEVAECTVLPFEDGHLGYVTKRFDLLNNNQKLFVEDAASLCLCHPANKGDPDMWSYEYVIKTLFTASGKKLPIVMKGLQQVLFAYLIGNNDLHLKNFSMFRDASSDSVIMKDFAPLYDLLSVFPYPEYQGDYLALSLTESERKGDFTPEYEAYGDYSQFDFISLGMKLGLNEKAATAFVVNLTNKVEKHLEPIIRASFMPEEMQNSIIKQAQYRVGCMRRARVS